MQPHDDPIKRLARQYRAAIEPGPAHVEHERARLMERLAAPAPASPARPRRVHRGLLFGAVAAALLLLWGALGAYIDVRVQQAVDASLAARQAAPGERRSAIIEDEPRRGAARRSAIMADEPPRSAVPPLSPIAVSGDASSPPSAVPTPASSSPIAVPGDSSRDVEASAPALGVPTSANGRQATPRSSRSHGAAELDADELLREGNLLSQAREAEARGDWARALELVDEHRKAYPQGGLLEERLVLEAAAACGAGLQARAQKAAQALRRRFPRSLALARVAEMCPEAGDE
jgi:hypothetical protein